MDRTAEIRRGNRREEERRRKGEDSREANVPEGACAEKMCPAARFEALLAVQCAPTLAGWKAGSLFPWRGDGQAEADRWARELAPYGLGLHLMRRERAPSLFYLCRERLLREILGEAETAAFLRSLGYRTEGGCGVLLGELARRLQAGFPHEIGLFLGYPLRDVVLFMENHGQNYTCCGCWKSYGDPEEAERLFARVRRCTEYYRRCTDMGIPLTRLIAAA